MWVGNGYGGQTTTFGNCADGVVINQRQAIPQDVPARALQHERPLADSKGRLGQDCRETGFASEKLVLVARSEFFECGPLLSIEADILPFFGTYGTGLRRLGRRWVL